MKCFFLVFLNLLLLVALRQTVQGNDSFPLRIVMNTEDKGEHILVMTPGGDILMTREQLNELGFRGIPEKARISSDGFVPLSSLSPEVSFKINTQEATLVIIAEPGLLEKNVIHLGYQRPDDVIDSQENSAFFNYAIAHSMGEKFNFSSLNIPAEIGIRISDYLLYSNGSYTRSDTESRFERRMTNVTRDDTMHMRRYTLGDFYAFSGVLGGGGIMGGASITKNFSINPYFVRYQGLALSGILDTPSEVELYINNVSLQKAKLPPGEFEFVDLYGRTGSGNAVLVIRDAFGRKQSIFTPFYLSSRLLKPGHHDYSYNMGFRRFEFGKESFNYDEPTFIGYHRYGISESLTGGLSGELDDDIQNLGVAATFVPDRFGEVDTAIGVSRSVGKYGYGAYFNYTYAGSRMSRNASFRYFSRDYMNLSFRESGSKPKFEARTGMGVNSRKLGSLSATVQFISRYEEDDIKRISVYYNRSLGKNVNLSINAVRSDEQNTTYEVFASIVVLLGRDHFGTLNVQSQDSNMVVSAGIEKNQMRGTGISYKVNATSKQNDDWEPGGLAHIQYKGPYGIYSAGYRRTSGSTSYDLALSGGIVFMKGTLYPTRPITDSFGLVTVGDLGGVKVLFNNEEVAVTNGKGKAIVPGLLSYSDNKLSIEPSDIPINYEINKLDIHVSPPYRAGSMIPFNIRKIQAFEGRLYLATKSDKKPAESAVMKIMIDERIVEAVVGKRGEFYIENLSPGRFPSTVTLAGSVCQFEMIIPKSSEMVVDLGEMTCEMD